MSEEQQGAAPATAQAVAGRIFDDAVRHDLKPNGRCWVACDMNIAAALIAAYADARVAEAVEKHVQRARIEIGRRVVAEAEVARLAAERDALVGSVARFVAAIRVYDEMGVGRCVLCSELHKTLANRSDLPGIVCPCVCHQARRIFDAVLAGPPPAATGAEE